MSKQTLNRNDNEKQKKCSRVKDLKKNKKRNGIIGVIIVVFSLGIIIDRFNKTYIYNNNIAKNIFIENVDVSQMTKEEAIKAVSNNYSPKNIDLSYEDKKYDILPKDIDLKYNVEKAVQEAYNYTKTDKYIENVKRYFSLKDNKKDIEIKSSYDEAKLSEYIQKISKDINVDRVNSKVYISNLGDISTSPSTVGKELDVASTKESIINTIKNKEYNEIQLKVNIKNPNIKTEDAKSIDTLLAQFTTKFSTNASSRVHNIITAANKSSNILLMPGEEFSYNNLTGIRNKSNGYKDAPVIINGKLEDALGGGVCQVSTTLYNSVLSSGLQLTSRTNHSLVSSYVPLGRDAMVNDVGTDFRFKNPYSHPIYIKNIVGNGTVTSRIYGNSMDKKNIDIKVDTFKQNGLDAAKTYRLYKDSNGNVVKKEYIDKSVYKKAKK
ncbi:VanW family protein [Romboutsia sp.]|uniref:VanW family protein n=1 Tax=Romboutsia sp. TaxID=1965302 RepID=UPI002B85104D|nr:VanW family protein [Romboutsia sp.]HSQ87602.1 VanW family protein [Romboutsia sp.]